jgi:hypothetical protein
MRCASPHRNVWGGPPDGSSNATLAAGKTAFAPRGKLELATVINRDIWEINYKMKRPTPSVPPVPTGSKSMGLMFGMLLLVGLGTLVIRRGQSRLARTSRLRR